MIATTIGGYVALGLFMLGLIVLVLGGIMHGRREER
jgi:hypothetical protein